MAEEYLNKIHNEDCFKTMESMIEDGIKVDIILTSPPYNTSRKGSSLTNACENIRYDEFDDCRSNDEYSEWTVDLFDNFDKILQKDGVILYNLCYSAENTDCMWTTIADVIRNTNFTVGDCITWKKKNATPASVSPNKLTRICEYVFVFCRKEEFHTYHCNKPVTSYRPNGQKMYKNIMNFIEAPNNDGACDIHKATFSKSLVVQLLKMYAKDGALVYDPFMGIGTTALGCIFNGNQFVGSEISKRYVDIFTKTIEKENKLLTLF